MIRERAKHAWSSVLYIEAITRTSGRYMACRLRQAVRTGTEAGQCHALLLTLVGYEQCKRGECAKGRERLQCCLQRSRRCEPISPYDANDAYVIVIEAQHRRFVAVIYP